VWPNATNRTRDEQNRTEQNNKTVFFILYFENNFWSILLFAKNIFLKLLFENTLHNDEE